MSTALDDEFDDEEDIPSAGEAVAGELHERFHWQCDASQGPLRIDRWIMERIAHTSRTRVQAAAEAGWIRVNGKPVAANYKVRPADDIVVLMAHPRRENPVEPEDIPINIVYEDEALLVVNKPAGMCVHPAVGNWTGTLVNALAWHLSDNPLFANRQDPRPGLVHRIDKETSGLLVIAKTEEAKLSLSRQMFEKTTGRSYQAIVWGRPEPPDGTIRGNIARSQRDRKLMDVFPDNGPVGKPAVTHYHTLEPLRYATLVECRLETGRTHQIRVHMRKIGHPLFADPQYGGDRVLRGENTGRYRQWAEGQIRALHRQALHAKTLAFTHPVSGERLEFDSPLPDDLQHCLDAWRALSNDLSTTKP